jgi:hypothetical protein
MFNNINAFQAVGYISTKFSRESEPCLTIVPEKQDSIGVKGVHVDPL